MNPKYQNNRLFGIKDFEEDNFGKIKIKIFNKKLNKHVKNTFI